MEARSAEIAVLADTTGSASRLLKADQAVLRKMRHADEDVVVVRRAGQFLSETTHEHIDKPVDPTALRAVVRRHVH